MVFEIGEKSGSVFVNEDGETDHRGQCDGPLCVEHLEYGNCGWLAYEVGIFASW